MIGAILVFLVLAVGGVRAEDAPAPAAATPGPLTEAACLQACAALIDRCTSVFGPAMGDMRPFCQRAVVRRCRASGARVCEPPAGTR